MFPYKLPFKLENKYITEEEISEIRLRLVQIDDVLKTVSERIPEPIPEPEPGPQPIAAFSANVLSGMSPLTVKFINLSENATSYLWTLGNGSIIDVFEPVVVYATGKYTVSLSAINAEGTNTKTIVEYIDVIAPPQNLPPVADFTGAPVEGPAPLKVVWKNLTTGTEPITYEWDYNNSGYIGSTEKEPTSVGGYTSLGYHSVSLTAKNAYGSNKKTKLNYINVTPASPIPIPDPIPIPTGYGASSNNTGNPIGGGQGYTKIITNGNYLVTNATEFLLALTKAKTGDILFIPGTATIDLTDKYGINIPAGVTIASDRGYNGSLGGIISRPRVYTLDGGGRGYTFNITNPNVRFTGLRIRGGDSIEDLCIDVEDGNCKGKITSFPQAVYSGITFRGNNCEVDNCELFNWSWRAIGFQGGIGGYVHHNYIHHCHARGYGYGVGVHEGGQYLAEANVFDYTRHALASSGGPTDDYEARYNIVMGHGNAFGGHHFDVHAPGGGTTYIHHNTFQIGDGNLYSIGLRACPVKFTVTNNIFEKTWGDDVGFEKCGSFNNIVMTNNMINGVLNNTVALLRA
jgi:PKD repeat protein